jgi:hypothetical protein
MSLVAARSVGNKRTSMLHRPLTGYNVTFSQVRQFLAWPDFVPGRHKFSGRATRDRAPVSVLQVEGVQGFSPRRRSVSEIGSRLAFVDVAARD